MAEDLGLRFIRRTVNSTRHLNYYGGGLGTHYEWWNEDVGWTRIHMDASPFMADEVVPIIRALKMENDPRVIQTIAVTVIGERHAYKRRT